MSALDELWEGEIAPWERTYSHVPGYEQAMARLADADARLRQQLGEEQRRLLDEVQGEEDEIHLLCLQEMFRYSFSLGARLTLEVFTSPGTGVPGG